MFSQFKRILIYITINKGLFDHTGTCILLVKKSFSETFGIFPYFSWNFFIAVKHKFSAVFIWTIFLSYFSYVTALSLSLLYFTLSDFDSLYTFIIVYLKKENKYYFLICKKVFSSYCIDMKLQILLFLFVLLLQRYYNTCQFSCLFHNRIEQQQEEV